MVGEGEIIEKCLRIGAADIAMEASERTNELEIWSRMELGQERTIRFATVLPTARGGGSGDVRTVQYARV